MVWNNCLNKLPKHNETVYIITDFNHPVELAVYSADDQAFFYGHINIGLTNIYWASIQDFNKFLLENTTIEQ